MLSAGVCDEINLVGPPGSGKTTALRHLAAVLPPDAPVRLVDLVPGRLSESHRIAIKPDRAQLAVVASVEPIHPSTNITMTLAPWSDDDLIEYLLFTHKQRCQSVMTRVMADAGRSGLGGSPLIWRIVLDHMAADESVCDIDSALRRHLELELCDQDCRDAAESFCLYRLAPTVPQPPPFSVDRRLSRVLSCRPVQMILAAERLAADFSFGITGIELHERLPKELVQRTADLSKESPVALRRIEQIADGGDRLAQPMAVSLLHAMGFAWRPRAGEVAMLAGAYLAGLRCQGAALDHACLVCTDLRAANLSGANCDHVKAKEVLLNRAVLSRASLRKADLESAELTAANLSDAIADGVNLRGANVESARLDGASLRNANLRHANVGRASFVSANLADADFGGAHITGADFRDANLRGAKLRRMSLRGARWTGADFRGADLTECNLEGMRLRNARFREASLAKSLFTGCRMRRADFRGADLTGAKLAEVDWRDADLRNADLTGATFHMGSTRSGMVGSDLACEGSRTGFYTNDFHDRRFKDPREIRKANLRGVDLRGAKIDQTDFYLVDLRGARYTAEQREHLLRCGAILRR